MSDSNSADPKFQAIARASALASIENKHVQYISMADRRAQGLLTISAILMPFAISQIENPQSKLGVVAFLICALFTIISATICLMPKRYGQKPGENGHLLHFSGISRYEEDKYLEEMAVLTRDTTQLAQELSRDLYHLSQDVLLPKFRWLRIAYFSFVTGLSLCLGLLLYGYLSI